MQLNFEVFHSQLNATNLKCVTHDVAVNEFRKAEESVSLLVEKNAEAQMLVSVIREGDRHEPSHYPS